MRISVVVPALDEESELGPCLDSVARQCPPAHEVLVVDGGSRDATRELARAAGARVVESARGRGRQLNAGAREARGELLLFLHADTRLPEGALAAVLDGLSDPACAGGAFHKRFRQAPRLNRGVRWRTRLWHRFGAVFGDQALFLRRRDFLELGGFREDLEAEDAELMRRLAGRGRIELLELEVETSARRLESEGTLATWWRWWRTWSRERLTGRGRPSS